MILFVYPFERYPIAREGGVPSDLDRSRLEFSGLEGQTLAGFGRDPVSDMVFTDGR